MARSLHLVASLLFMALNACGENSDPDGSASGKVAGSAGDPTSSGATDGESGASSKDVAIDGDGTCMGADSCKVTCDGAFRAEQICRDDSSCEAT